MISGKKNGEDGHQWQALFIAEIVPPFVIHIMKPLAVCFGIRLFQQLLK
jgi:hypothetical protein